MIRTHPTQEVSTWAARICIRRSSYAQIISMTSAVYKGITILTEEIPSFNQRLEASVISQSTIAREHTGRCCSSSRALYSLAFRRLGIIESDTSLSHGSMVVLQ